MTLRFLHLLCTPGAQKSPFEQQAGGKTDSQTEIPPLSARQPPTAESLKCGWQQAQTGPAPARVAVTEEMDGVGGPTGGMSASGHSSAWGVGIGEGGGISKILLGER